MKAKKYFSLLLCIIITLSISMEYIPAHAENVSDSDTTSFCVHHPEHTEECSYTEAMESQPCTHTHDENCGYRKTLEEVPCGMACTDLDSDGVIDHVEGCAYQPAAEGQPCTHQHDESCGYAEVAEGTPCTYAVNGCPYCVVYWEWIDSQQMLTESEGGWGLGLAGASQDAPLTHEVLAELLPEEITASTDSGESVTLALTWDLSSLPEEGVYEGEYTLTASLPDPYALTQDAEALSVILQLGDGETYSALPSGTPSYSERNVNGVSPNGTTIDLFDYWITAQTDADNKDPWENGVNMTQTSGINNGHALVFSASDSSRTEKWNQWTGNSNPYPGIVQDALGSDGYPVLAVSDSNESLSYLFDPNVAHEGKESYANVQGLLQVDSDGYYYYNSQENYAVYYQDSNSFALYEYPGVVSGGASGTVGQFFPFNEATANATTQWYKPPGSGGTEGYYTLMNHTSSTDASLNHYFGLHMSTRFIQQYGGHVDSSANAKAVTYEFSGDDDVWIFIDGTLIADLGGIHDAASVKIDFSTGKITINNVVQSDTLGRLLGYNSDTLPDDAYHTLDFFYLERGHVDSNMNLKYNLVTIPESDLIKIDQIGDPVPGAEFSLYAADDYEKNGTEATPIASGTTDSKGEFVFLDDKGIPITIQSLYNTYNNCADSKGNHLILVETETPSGYRSGGEIGLYFYQGKSDEVLLLSNNVWDEGAYAMPKVTATAPNVIRSANNPDDQVILSGVNAVEKPVMFAVIFQKQTNAEDGSYTWLPVSGDPLNGWNVWQDSTWSSILAAAQASPYLFRLASSGAYQVEISNLPGDIKTYYHLCQNEDTAKYTIGYYYTTAPSLAQATEENTWRIDSDPDQTGSQYALERAFSMDLYVPNVKNYLLVQKVDDEGNTVAGAEFCLYQASDVNIADDGTVTPKENAKPYDSLTTADATGSLNLDGGGGFPATQDVLPSGEYYLIETSAPAGYKLNDTAIHVIVDDTGVYADAGTTEDGVTVLRGVGSVLKSVVQFAVDDGVDTTLQGIKAALATSVTYVNGSFTWSDANWASGDVLHLQYANSNKLLDYGLYDDDAATTAGSIDDLTLATEEGWSKLLIQQCYQHDDTVDVSLKSNLATLGYTDITSLFSGTVTVRVANEKTGNLKIGKTVTGADAPSGQEFTFTVTVMDGDTPISGEYDALSESNIISTILFDENGTATVTLKAGESLSILDLPTGSTYTVTETSLPAGYTPSVSVRNDTNAQISGVQVTGNIQHNTTLGDAVELNYVNHFDNTSALTVSKTVTGNMGDRDQAFEFQITLKDAKGIPLAGSFTYTGNSMNGIDAPDSGTLMLNNGIATFTLKHGQGITISGLPAGTQYIISEPEAEADGYTTTITVGTEKAQAGYEVNDTLPAMASVLVAFENQRDSPPTTGIEQNTQPWLLAAGIAAAAGMTWFLVHQIFRGKRRKESRDSHGR